MEININIDERNRNLFTANTEGGDLVGLTMRLKPEDAVRMANVLVNQAAPIIAWNNHPLKQWANRKTGKT